ncbi:MAG: hypothetical protein HYU27_09450 [Acidobacteria bacterium]|nr:hypothetical protein [Acidobacteriota bacterium]
MFSIALLIAGMSAGLAAQNIPFVPQNPQVQQQQQQEEEKTWVTRIFPVKYADPDQLRAVLSMFRANSTANQSLRVLSIRAPKEIMPAIEDAIKMLDVPSPRKDAELTVYVLMASDQPDGAVPANLQSVVTELRKVLAYKGFMLLDTLIARGGEGRDVTLQGVLPLLGASARSSYSLHAQLRSDSPDGKTGVLRVRQMRFTLFLQNPGNPDTQVVINTDVEIPQGQQVVVGKATFIDKAFILVMTAKF